MISNAQRIRIFYYHEHTSNNYITNDNLRMTNMENAANA